MRRPTREPGRSSSLVIVGLSRGRAAPPSRYFTTTGAGSAASGVGEPAQTDDLLGDPAAGGTVTVTWGGDATGAGAVTYYVTRDGGVPAGTCPSSRAPAAVTTCTDKGVELGTHTYVVDRCLATWSATSSPASAKVTVGAATHFALCASLDEHRRGRLRQPDDHREGREPKHGDHLHRLPQPDLLAAPRRARGTAPTRRQQLRHRGRLRAATAITFTAGVATVSSSQERADEALPGRSGRRSRSPTGRSPRARRTGGHGRRRGALQVRPRRPKRRLRRRAPKTT